MHRVVPAALAGLFIFAATHPAKIAPPPSVVDRVAASSVVVVGKVTGFEKDTVKGKDGIEYKVAVVKVESALVGAKDLTHVKVGFVPSDGGPRRRPTLNLQVGTEGLFFLAQSGDLLVARNYYDVIARLEHADFDKQLDLAKKAAVVAADPMVALKAKDQGDRLVAAAFLIRKYRNRLDGAAKTEPIPADESKLILQALAAEADWNRYDPYLNTQPVFLFNLLGVTAKDGFNRPMNFQEVPTAAKAWIKENADKYRIQRYVRDSK
jgi:hypothetical protein